MTKKVGFIGAGYMGYGMAKNILKNNFDLSVIAHKNREPIEKLLKLGANEVSTYDDLAKNINCLIICVTNTIIAKEIANKIVSKLKAGTLFIDITTHHKNGSVEMQDILSKNKIKYLYFVGKNKKEMYFFEEFINENKCIIANQLNELLVEFDISQCKF